MRALQRQQCTGQYGPLCFPCAQAPKLLSMRVMQHRKRALRATPGQSRETVSPNSNGTAEAFHVEPLVASQPETKKPQFNWYKAWYPMAVLEDLDPAVPTPLKLLGMDMVVWYDRNGGEWRAFQDRCPHRLAPLSEGRIDEATGNLFCNYHGWQFNGQGSCTSVPQLPHGQPLNPNRSCAISYPTRQEEGLLWVWPDASPAALVESAAEDAWPGLAPEITLLGDKAFTTSLFNNHKWYARDLPASYLAAKENAYNDCSHDTVLHHGVASINRQAARPISAKLLEMTPTGYSVREASGFFEDTTRFPCGARRDYPLSGGGAGVAYIVPTGVGTCRQFHAFLDRSATQKLKQLHSNGSGGVAPSSSGKSDADGNAGNASSSSAAKVAAPKRSLQVMLTMWLWSHTPTWLQHMQSHLLIDADLAMQSRVDVNRAINDHVYMPAAADAGPAAYMRWLKEYGGGGPPVAKLTSPFMGQAPAVPTDRRQLLDRFNTHTLHCKACRTAYTQLSAAKVAAAVVAVMCGSAAIAAGLLLAVGWPSGAAAAGVASGSAAAGKGLGVVAALAGVGAAAAWLYTVLSRLVQGFVFVDYDRHHCSKK